MNISLCKITILNINTKENHQKLFFELPTSTCTSKLTCIAYMLSLLALKYYGGGRFIL